MQNTKLLHTNTNVSRCLTREIRWWFFCKMSGSQLAPIASSSQRNMVYAKSFGKLMIMQVWWTFPRIWEFWRPSILLIYMCSMNMLPFIQTLFRGWAFEKEMTDEEQAYKVIVLVHQLAQGDRACVRRSESQIWRNSDVDKSQFDRKQSRRNTHGFAMTFFGFRATRHHIGSKKPIFSIYSNN